MFRFFTNHPQGASSTPKTTVGNTTTTTTTTTTKTTTTTHRLEQNSHYTYAVVFRTSGFFLRMVCEKPKHVRVYIILI
jgi:hypothetical protein